MVLTEWSAPGRAVRPVMVNPEQVVPEAKMSDERVRVVSFLGLGNREKLPEDRYVACRHGFATAEGAFASTVVTPLHDLGTWEWLRDHRGLAPEAISIELLGTDKVREHWVDGGHLLRLMGTSGLFEGGPPPRVGFTQLADGDDQALWSVFETVRAALDPTPRTLTLGERQVTEAGPPTEIIVDITHGFRSQPFLAAAVLVYVSSQVKRAAREAGPEAPPAPRLRILYAAFEKNDRLTPPTTPVWELTRFLDVLAWDGALDDLMRHGRGDDLQALLSGERTRRVAAAPDDPTRAVVGRQMAPVAKLAKATRNFADALTTVRTAALLRSRAPDLLEAMAEARTYIDQELKVLGESFTALERWCAPLCSPQVVSAEGLAASLELARRYGRLERHSELSALLRETLVTAWSVATRAPEACRQPGEGGRFTEQRLADERQLNALAHARRGAGRSDGALDPELARLAEALSALVDVRNDVQHAGFNAQPESAEVLRRQLGERLALVKVAVAPFTVPRPRPAEWRAAPSTDASDAAEPAGAPARGARPVFLNCSNHPSAAWSAPQRAAALALGAEGIVDVPFPAVPPHADSAAVAALAQALVEALLAGGRPAAVHLAGEFTLTFAAVDRLLAAEVPVYAATAERRVVERLDADGHTAKDSLFVFSGWRPYGRVAPT